MSKSKLGIFLVAEPIISEWEQAINLAKIMIIDKLNLLNFFLPVISSKYTSYKRIRAEFSALLEAQPLKNAEN